MKRGWIRRRERRERCRSRECRGWRGCVRRRTDESEVVQSKDEDVGRKEERKMWDVRGKGKCLKRYMTRQRKGVIDPTALTIWANLEKQKEEKKGARVVAQVSSSQK